MRETEMEVLLLKT